MEMVSSIGFGGMEDEDLAWVYGCSWWERLLIKLRIVHGGPLFATIDDGLICTYAQCNKCRNWTDLFSDDITPFWAVVTGEPFRGRGLCNHDWHWNGEIWHFNRPYNKRDGAGLIKAPLE